jgi:NAD(P)H-nitrite reductase large subunit
MLTSTLFKADQGLSRSIINRQAYPLSRQLDAAAGEMVLRRIEALGVKVHTNVNVKEMLVEPAPGGTGEEVFKGFEFDDGEIVGASRLASGQGQSSAVIRLTT